MSPWPTGPRCTPPSTTGGRPRPDARPSDGWTPSHGRLPGIPAPIEAFGRGTGNLGTGQAATCWVDLSRSYSGPDELDDARKCAAAALADATASEHPWIRQQAQARLAEIPTG